MVEDVVMPAALFPDLDEQKELSSRIVVLAQQYGILLGKGDERVSIGAASPELAKTINVEAGAPILVLDRLGHDLRGRAGQRRGGMGQFAGKYYLAEIS